MWIVTKEVIKPNKKRLSEKFEKTVDKRALLYYNGIVTKYGGIAQLARACGSYPQCRWFESDYRYHTARWSSG